MRANILTLSLLGLLVFTSCQKEDPPPPTNTDLIARNWKITSMTGSFPPLPAVNLLSQIPDCEKDNIIQIKSNGTFTVDEGPTKCNPSDPQTADTGTWSFSNNDTKLTILDQTFDVVSLSATTLELKQVVAAGGSLPAGTITLTLTAQ